MWSSAVARGSSRCRSRAMYYYRVLMDAASPCHHHHHHHHRALSSSTRAAAPFGVVFDIDGVLARGKEPIKAARPVMEYMASAQVDKDETKRIPYILMTNGGGLLEDAKTQELNDILFPGLSVPVAVSQVLLSHTPMKGLAAEYKDKVVLALGSKDYVHVAKSYGFKKVITVDDLAHWYPDLYPFRAFLHKNHLAEYDEPIAAVLILHDPTDWALEIQVLCDVINGGVLAGHPNKANAQQVPVFASNPDLIFSSTYPEPRLAQGAFVSAWQHVYKTAYGGGPLQITQYGKPSPAAYRYAEHMLVHECRRVGVVPPYIGAPHLPHPPQQQFPLKTVYAVGDNPASDIQGATAANAHNTCKWVSILVRTGVFGGRGDNDKDHPADYVVDDVQAALHLILKLEGRL